MPCRTLGAQLIRLSRNRASVGLDWREDLVGNPDTGVVHGGIINNLLDQTSGLAILCALTELETMATLDLRIDYRRPAEPRRRIKMSQGRARTPPRPSRKSYGFGVRRSNHDASNRHALGGVHERDE